MNISQSSDWQREPVQTIETQEQAAFRIPAGEFSPHAKRQTDLTEDG
jgi:hypothetical protein